MEGHFLWDIAGSGLWILFLIMGFLALVLPGRFLPAPARRVGLGRHVEALLLVSLIITFALGTVTHVPVFVGPGGVVAVSLLGAVVPTILGVYFLLASGWRRFLVSLVPLAVVSVAAFMTSQPVADLGIIARPPYYFIPAVLAAAGALIVGWRSLHAIPLGYAYGSLGALIGADFMRIDWILGTPLTAASIGGADALDLVFLMGMWSAGLAAIPFAPRLLRANRKNDPWTEVAALAHERKGEAALDLAEKITRTRLDRWARERGYEQLDQDTLSHLSTARPVFDSVARLRSSPRPWEPGALKEVLENLSGLDKRLQVPALDDIAPRGERFLAGLIDLLPVLLVAGLAFMGAILMPLEPMPTEDPEMFEIRRFLAGGILVLWSTFAAHVLYPFFAEWFSNGRTLGKAALGLQVRRRDGGRPSGWDLFVRNLTRLLDVLLLYMVPFLSSREGGRQRLGDYFADTYVIKKSVTSIQAETADPTMMPPSAGQWSTETNR